MRIYKRSFKEKSKFNLFEWFAIEPDYGNQSYGSILDAYELSNNAHLLDLGITKNRNNLIKAVKNNIKLLQKYPNPEDILDSNEQYSGYRANNLAHRMIMDICGDSFDGTIIDTNNVDDPELEGPSEICLWNFNVIKKLTN